MAITCLESAYAIKYGKLFRLSEQQIVDCSTRDAGCNGGWPTNSFVYFKTNGVVESLNYPYRERVQTCTANATHLPKVFKTVGYKDVTYYSLDAFKVALRLGPVGVAFAVGNSFYSYRSGIYSPTDCAAQVNHGMVAVGFGVTSTGVQFVTIRNSWGVTWGEAGHLRVKITPGETNGGVC